MKTGPIKIEDRYLRAFFWAGDFEIRVAFYGGFDSTERKTAKAKLQAMAEAMAAALGECK